MASLSLLEAAKLMEPSRKAKIIDIFASSYQPLAAAPVLSTSGKSVYQWTVDDSHSYAKGNGKRNVGADFTASAGRVKPYESEVKIYGGKVEVDEFIVDHSPDSVETEKKRQIITFARELVTDVFEGAGGTSIRGFRHWMLNDAAYKGQEISAGSTASGNLITLDLMDELTSKVDRTPDTFIVCNDTPARLIKKLSRGNGSDQQRIEYVKDDYGMWSWAYDGIPVVVLHDGSGTNILATDEIDGASSQSNTTSVYCISWGPEAAALFSSQSIIGPNGVPIPKVTEQTNGTNFIYEKLSWYVGLVPHKPRCIARIKHVKNALA